MKDCWSWTGKAAKTFGRPAPAAAGSHFDSGGLTAGQVWAMVEDALDQGKENLNFS